MIAELVFFNLFLIELNNFIRISEPYELALDNCTAFKRPPHFTLFQRHISLF